MEKAKTSMQETWDSESIEVFKRMDAFDATSSMTDEDRLRLVTAGFKFFTNIEKIADSIINASEEERDEHLETMIMILAFTPSLESLTYLQEMMEKRPDIYRIFFRKVMDQKPLQDSGRIVRQRIVVALKRATMTQEVYAPHVNQSVLAVIESFQRRR
ncbi:MAG: hypothetical protein ACJAS1_003148 [Oleiphilaceae bacterium]|jgi:hypothetical protein